MQPSPSNSRTYSAQSINEKKGELKMQQFISICKFRAEAVFELCTLNRSLISVDFAVLSVLIFRLIFFCESIISLDCQVTTVFLSLWLVQELELHH